MERHPRRRGLLVGLATLATGVWAACTPQASVRPTPGATQAVGPAQSANTAGTLTPAEARVLAAQDAVMLDVRTPEEFAEGHLEGAVNVPVQVLEAGKVPDVPREQPVIVYCRSGRRSAKAAELLRAQGYSQVYDLGPMPAAD